MELTCNTSSSAYFFASSRTTSFICAHGAAHGAQKLTSDTLARSVDSRVWNCSDEVIMWKFEGVEAASAVILDGYTCHWMEVLSKKFMGCSSTMAERRPGRANTWKDR